MTSSSSFGANDAQIRTEDDNTRFIEAKAAVVYYERELQEARAVVDRLSEKAVRYQQHLDEINTEISEALVSVTELEQARDEVRAVVDSYTGEAV